MYPALIDTCHDALDGDISNYKHKKCLNIVRPFSVQRFSSFHISFTKLKDLFLLCFSTDRIFLLSVTVFLLLALNA